ncbi:carbohydrate ABC transporter permease [Acholeplasma vituli]|uniref:Carbohydrate ABC transporter permease n=1 Tax=Paracholeplasma vituli TaxID=69473 RepID=A0ABT2PT39_9MOLU|nr:carbohydrate ABC transporter permease [Paracholeplasma vituli]MCU0104112.1 carbohydrate ABC transporter permease [Paracholeplasma vituli]
MEKKKLSIKQKFDSPKYRREFIQNTLLWIIRIVLGLIFAFPLYWAITTSFKPLDEIISPTINLLIKNPTFEHYSYVLTWRDYNTNKILIFNALINTLTLTVLGGVLNITVSAIAGYSFAKLKFKGHKVIFRILLLSMMIPGIITMMPTFIVISRLKLWGSFMGVILPGIASVFNIFFMRQFFITLPDELGESAEIDGAGEMRIFFQIYLPQVKPALAALAIFNFQGGWNNFLMPYVVLPTNKLVLSTFIRSFPAENYGQTMAASMLATLPVLILFIVFQKYFMQSVTLTGLKE